jgi:hypothetical protein
MKKHLLYTAHVFLLFFLFSLLASSQAEAQTCVLPPSELISWWSGDGNADDIQNVNNGTLQGDATFAAGMVGQAFSFDGVGDYVEAPENGSLDFNGSFSIDLWVKPNGFLPDSSSSPMVSKYDFSQGFPNVAYEFSLWPDGRVQFVVTCDTTNMNRRTVPGVIPVGEFSHVAAVYRQEVPRLEIYVNGQLQPGDTRRSCSFINQNDIPVRIGKRINSSWESFFYGLIDEVEVFNRALEPEEILDIYNAGSAGKCKGVINADIDIKPGSDPVCNGVIPIAILGSDTLDVIQIDQTTLSFEGEGVRVRGNGVLSCDIRDANSDGYDDLVCRYEDTTTEGTLTGELLDGTLIEGADTFCLGN